VSLRLGSCCRPARASSASTPPGPIDGKPESFRPEHKRADGRLLLVIILRVVAVLAASACAFGQAGSPYFRIEDVRPHGSADPHPLTPGLLTWIFGTDLSRPPGCSAPNPMDPATYKTELCGTRVLVGGIEAKLIAVMPGQINLVLPGHPWENEMVDFQVVRDGRASALVPVYFGFSRPVISLREPAFAGMPVWVRVEKPWGKGWLRYPFYTEPWDMGGGSFEVRSQGRDLPILTLLPYPPPDFGGMTMGLPHEVPARYLHRVPLHLVYPMDQPGIYQIRYTEYRAEPAAVSREFSKKSSSRTSRAVTFPVSLLSWKLFQIGRRYGHVFSPGGGS